jgi:hypothetical protein
MKSLLKIMGMNIQLQCITFIEITNKSRHQLDFSTL